MCSFCGRPRTLRREEHQLGTLLRTIVTCETCHRTLSSTMGVAEAEPPEQQPAVEAEPVAAPPAEKPRRAPAKRPAAAKKPAAAAGKPNPKPKAPAKRTTTKK